MSQFFGTTDGRPMLTTDVNISIVFQNVIEEQMSNDGRLSLVYSLSGSSRFTGGRDKRYPADAPSTADYTPGVPRLGVPALLSSDASMGITNPIFHPDDKGATAFPASI
jgi:beta-glucosidase